MSRPELRNPGAVVASTRSHHRRSGHRPGHDPDVQRCRFRIRPQHSQSAENWFLNIPGLKIVVPGTVEDLYGLLRSAIRDDDPVLVFEHKNLFAVKGFVPSEPDDRFLVPIGVAQVVRGGSDVTVVATQQMRHRAVQAAEQLASQGIDVEVIDPRTLIPFDIDTVVASLQETSRLVVVQEGHRPADGEPP